MQRPPKIGKRIIKSSLAVFICLLIGSVRPGALPFYSAIASILCMQPNVTHTMRVGLNRTIGTLIGGTGGFIMVVLLRALHVTPFSMLYYFLISLFIIPLIYVTVLLKKTTASYITCVVFLSVTISHIKDVSPAMFALNRIIDTLIGIAVALVINHFLWNTQKSESAEQES